MERTHENEIQEKREGCCCSAPESPKQEERRESRRTYLPHVDILDGETESLLLIDLPGIEKDSLDITLEKNTLTVKARQASLEREGYKLAYSEYGVGDYERSFTLTENVNRDEISASMQDGVLSLRIPKAEPAVKKISLSSN